jgi:hypothetical protein
MIPTYSVMVFRTPLFVNTRSIINLLDAELVGWSGWYPHLGQTSSDMNLIFPLALRLVSDSF